MSVCVGCGLEVSVGNVLEVDTCVNGGLACGTTSEDAECLYVNVQGQGNGLSVPLATAQTGPSPNCNGLVRTSSGMWAPPKIYAGNAECGSQRQGDGGEISNNAQTLTDASDLPALGAPFASVSTDTIYAPTSADEVIFWEVEGDPCNPMVGNTWGNFHLSYEVFAGEHWRWIMWERIANVVGLGGGPLVGTTWALVDMHFVDNRDGASTRIESVHMTDTSSICLDAGQFARGEMMVTFNRLAGAGALDNDIISPGTDLLQYRYNLTSYHVYADENFGSYNI